MLSYRIANLKILWFMSLLQGFEGLNAQSYSLSLNLYGNDHLPIKEAIVQLLQSKDSSLVKNEFSDDKGQVVFSELATSDYLVQINIMGYRPYLSPSISLNEDYTYPDIILEQTELQLNEVAVVAKVPYVEREKGKIILNVENSINTAGSSVFELLEKAPGVRVDQNENISYNGKMGVAIWIDGKPTPMTGSDLANYLRGIPSSSIEKIEMVSNPSSKYDAAGSSIINIKFKKDKRAGTNGSVSTSYGQGIYMKNNNSVNLNHRDKQINCFANYSYANREAFSHLKLYRSFYENDNFLGAYNQDNYLKFDFKNHVARLGMDYYINPKNVIGFTVNGISNKFKPKGDNVSEVYDNNHINSSVFYTKNRSQDHWYNYSANINYQHSFDSLGTELSSDVDYAHFGNQTFQNFETRYYDINNLEFKNPYLLYGDLKGGLDIYSIKNDFSKSYNNQLKLEAGQKSSYVIADNNLAFYNQSNNSSVFDSSKSNHFIYTENINALYVNLAKDFGKWSTQLGLRTEHTYVTGRQLVNNTSFINHYIQLFPSGFLGYKLNEKHNLEINYSRRITRPSYDQLNPFKFYIDPTTYKEGNPYLKPQIIESFELSHIYKQKIISKLGFSRTNKSIAEVIAPSAEENKITIQTNVNLTHVDELYATFSLPIDVVKWWQINNELYGFYAMYTGNVANTQLQAKGNVNLNVNMINTFYIKPNTSAELAFNYRTKEIYAYDIIQPIWFFNIGCQQKLYNNKLIMKLNFADLFYSNKVTADVAFTDYKEQFIVSRDSRVVTFSLTYKFGKTTVSSAKRKKGGADDIKQRAGGNGVG